MRTRILSFIIVFCSLIANAQTLPHVASGRIERIENFKSQFVEARNVDIWLPEGYNATDKYSVVYMHDGQMLFDSTQTWNKREWGVDEIFSGLIKDRKINPCIIVAIWNTGGNRISEYFPNKIFSLLEAKTQTRFTEKYTNGKPANGDNYLKFVVTEEHMLEQCQEN